MEKLSRKEFLRSAAAGAVGVAAMSTLGGSAAFAATDINDPVNSWAGEEIVIDEADIKDTLDVEVLVVGSGTGGTFAALFLSERGLKPVIIEKNAMDGPLRGDLGAFNSRFVEEHDDLMDPADIFNQSMMYSAGRADARLVRLWMNESPRAIEELDDILQKHGVGYVYHDGGYKLLNGYEGPHVMGSYTKNPTGHHVRTTVEATEAVPRPSGIRVALAQNGVETMYETAMIKVEHDGFKVTGVIATNENGDYIRINAEKGVVIAAGGYQQNPDMFAQLQPHTQVYTPDRTWGTTCGDGHKALLWMGACMDDVHTTMLFDRYMIYPGETPRNTTAPSGQNNLGSQPFLKVDSSGKRFTNESTPYDYILHSCANTADGLFCIVFDANYAENVVDFETVGCSRNAGAYPSAAEDYANEREQRIAAAQERLSARIENWKEQGFLVEAGTIEELAEKMKVPAENLVKTVNRYNELCDNGFDEDFFKEPYRLKALRTPPYYSIRFCGTVLSTMDGIRIDTFTRPITKAGQPFENIFVIGDTSGGMFAHTYPNLFTGYAAGRTMTWARRAAQVIAGEVVPE